jgi:hypothetical protein
MATNLFSTFAGNPWTLLTAINLLSSVWSVIEWALYRPYLLVVPFLVPAHLRKPAGIFFFFLLTSGVLV